MWELHAQLLLFAITAGTDALLGSMRVGLNLEDADGSPSVWEPRDFEQVEALLSQLNICVNTEGVGLTAEFGLNDGAVSSLLGHTTALWQREGEQHPYLGGGLFCLLSMPHRVAEEAALDRILTELNVMEMAAQDLPPHFGAWTRGRAGDHPAYCGFLPNEFHSIPGIAYTISAWALGRAQWAHKVLASMGVSA